MDSTSDNNSNNNNNNENQQNVKEEPSPSIDSTTNVEFVESTKAMTSGDVKGDVSPFPLASGLVPPANTPVGPMFGKEKTTSPLKAGSNKVQHEVEKLSESVASLEVTKKKKRNEEEEEEDEDDEEHDEEDEEADEEDEEEGEGIDEEAKKLFEPVQSELAKARADYDKERYELELKYQALLKPVYGKRAEIVKTSDDEKLKGFWMQCLLSVRDVADNIQEHDEEALNYLTDIRVNLLKLEGGYGYSVEFEFDENPFFENKILTKTLEVTNLFSLGDYEFGNLTGTEIKWKSEDKDLTKVKIEVEDEEEGGQEFQPGSFFEYFDTKTTLYPKVNGEDVPLTDEQYMAIQRDYAISEAIRTKLVPDAVRWFTGEYQDDDAGDEGEEEEYDEDDEDEDDDDDDDEDDDDDDHHGHSHAHGHNHSHGKHSHSHTHSHSHGGHGHSHDDGQAANIPKFTFPSNNAPGGGAPGANPECKQN